MPDGSSGSFDPGVTLAEINKEIGLKEAVAASVNGNLVDLSYPLNEDTEISLIALETDEGIRILRHSTSHVMAQAVKDLFPEAQPTIGPSIEEGFYYDFDYPPGFSNEDLEKITDRMKEIIKDNLSIQREVLPREEAIKLFEKKGEKYKVELIEDIPDKEVSLYRQGDFIDLCQGPHLPSTGRIKAFELLSIAGAYWRGREDNPMLQRIYGTAFPTREQLKEHLKKLEEIKKRDHRRLGRELDLFSIQDETGAGLVLWHPKGARIRNIIEQFWRDEHYRAGYEMVFSPHIARLDLWNTSGHLDFYQENMYSPMEIDEVKYEIKPMNCPFHILIYQSRLRSYRELPIRWAELGTVYRYERSGVLHGLMRVRGFTQDDAHIYCRPDQLKDEITKVLNLTLFILESFGFEQYDVYLSTRPDKYVGTLDNWESATDALRTALEEREISYELDPGQGVFYGPKIDLKIKDVLGRPWQCATIQVDFNLPERFGITYRGEDGKEHQPIMIHRALMGSLERFFGVLIEHYAGAFPLWLAPVQTIVLAITDRNIDYGNAVYQKLTESGIRAEKDFRKQTLPAKIRDAEIQKIPYMVIVGDKEERSGMVSPRSRSEGNLKEMKIEDLVSRMHEEVAQKRR
ncbi:MAG: threonine--tRNA ligase [Deltaproteobacteria bacterium]|nr:MAG: threonine--tRNA ligase [Deltaproteobacteria bacterium]